MEVIVKGQLAGLEVVAIEEDPVQIRTWWDSQSTENLVDILFVMKIVT